MSAQFSRRRFVASSGAAVLGLPLLTQAAEKDAPGAAAAKPLLRFGLMADAQYADLDPLGTRYYRASIGKLSQAIGHFNGQELDFCVHLGDLIDKQWSSFDAVLKPVGESRHRIYQLLGNHDFAVLDAEKPEVPGRMGMTKRYYSFEHGGFRFVVLDTTAVSTYAHPEGTPPHRSAAGELERLKAAKLPNAQSWNSGVGERQIAWFETQCRDAAAAGQKVIVFAHHPVFPSGNVHNAWDSEPVLGAVERHRNVVAWFNGHNHAGAFGIHRDVPFVTLRGMVETADTNAFAVAAVYADRIVLTGHDREPSRELPLRTG
jgi:manganese-dependent ADP-ribose/CDP-alcohol diphosphatase